MANQTHQFKDRDVQRFVKSLTKSAGQLPSAVELNPRTGCMRGFFDPPSDDTATKENPWDQAIAEIK